MRACSFNVFTAMPRILAASFDEWSGSGGIELTLSNACAKRGAAPGRFRSILPKGYRGITCAAQLRDEFSECFAGVIAGFQLPTKTF